MLTGFSASLPAPPNPLIARESECASIRTLLEDSKVRMVTITGPGGVGKSHLALTVASIVENQFPDGVHFVPLDTVFDTDLVMPTIARTLGVREVAGETFLARVAEALRTARVLIVLDNVEQVIAAASEVGQMLSACPGISMLVTSRSPLRLRAEREYQLKPLPLPSMEREDRANGTVTGAEQLFIERARAVHPDFDVDASAAAAVAKLCRQLDGLPLAIELAAATMNVFSPQALLDAMSSRLDVLVGGAVDLPDRQRSLRSAIAWSHDLLSPDEQRLFCRMAVIAGESGIEGVESVAGESGANRLQLIRLLGALIDKSLVQRVDTADGEPRYRMLATIREYALECLAASGEAEVTRHRHLEWCVALAERAQNELTGPDQARWLGVLEVEHDNIRAALESAVDRWPSVGVRLATALWRFWATRGYLAEGLNWFSRLMDGRAVLPPDILARALASRGNLALDLGMYGEAFDCYDRATHLFEHLGDRRGVSDALNGQGLVAWYRGEMSAARDFHERSLLIREEIGNLQGQGNSLTNLANVLKDAGELARSRELHMRALAIRQRLGDTGGVGYSRLNLGDVARRDGQPEEARRYLVESLDAFRTVDDTLGIGYAQLALGLVALMSGDHLGSAVYFADAISVRQRMGDRRGVIECIEGIAVAAAKQSALEEAARLFGAAGALRLAIEAPLPEAEARPLRVVQRELERSLGGVAYTRLLDDGSSLDMVAAADAALAVARSISHAPTHAGALSEREADVLRLVASGMTNGQVAERLYLSRRTVDAHMRRIYDKLDLSSRADAIRWAIESGLAGRT